MARRSNRISGQFAPRLIEMLESPAFRILSLSGHRILNRLEVELGHHGGQDNGMLPVTYDDFVAYGMDRQAIAPAIREVEALGFAVITQRGRAGNAEWRKPNMFRLTYRPAKGIYGDGSHEWRNIQTVDEAIVIAKAARHALQRKTKDQWGKILQVSTGTSHQNERIHSGKSPLTNHGREIPPTLNISGGARKA